MRVDPALRAQLLAEIPSLRAFARSLTHDGIYADDLVQDTLVRAWSKMDSFEPGTNLSAWLFTILRHSFYSQQRKKQREVEDVDGAFSGGLAHAPEQGSRLDFEDFRKALAKLCPEQREALILIAAQGFSYEDAAGICGVATGTIKSRVSRGRARLEQLLAIEHPQDIGPDRLTMAALMAVTADLCQVVWSATRHIKSWRRRSRLVLGSPHGDAPEAVPLPQRVCPCDGAGGRAWGGPRRHPRSGGSEGRAGG